VRDVRLHWAAAEKAWRGRGNRGYPRREARCPSVAFRSGYAAPRGRFKPDAHLRRIRRFWKTGPLNRRRMIGWREVVPMEPTAHRRGNLLRNVQGPAYVR